MSAEGDGAAAGAKRLKPEGTVATLASLIGTLSNEKDDLLEEISLLKKERDGFRDQLLQYQPQASVPIEAPQPSMDEMTRLIDACNQAIEVKVAEIDDLNAKHHQEVSALMEENMSVREETIATVHIHEAKESQLLAEKHELEARLAGFEETKAQEIQLLNTTNEQRKQRIRELRDTIKVIGNDPTVVHQVLKLRARFEILDGLVSDMQAYRASNTGTRDPTTPTRLSFVFSYAGGQFNPKQFNVVIKSIFNTHGHVTELKDVTNVMEDGMHYCKITITKPRSVQFIMDALKKYINRMKLADHTWFMGMGPVVFSTPSYEWGINTTFLKIENAKTYQYAKPPAWEWETLVSTRPHPREEVINPSTMSSMGGDYSDYEVSKLEHIGANLKIFWEGIDHIGMRRHSRLT